MSINSLSQVTAVTAADQIPLYSAQGGGDVRVALSVLTAYLQALLTDDDSPITQYFAPNATGFSVTVVPAEDGGSVFLLLTPAAGYAAGTIVLPLEENCIDGQEVVVTTTQAVTTLTVSGNGATVNGAPTTLAANDFFRLRFDGVFNAWYRVG